MATWVDPVDSQTDPDAPITSDLAKRWDNNVVALAEGAPGAPRVNGIALDGLVVGYIPNGESGPVGLNNLGNFEQLIFLGVATWNSGTNTQRNEIRFSSDNGATFTSWENISFGLTNATSVAGNMVISKLSQTATHTGLVGSAYSHGSSPLAIPLGANAFQMRVSSGSGPICALTVMIGGGMS